MQFTDGCVTALQRQLGEIARAEGVVRVDGVFYSGNGIFTTVRREFCSFMGHKRERSIRSRQLRRNERDILIAGDVIKERV